MYWTPVAGMHGGDACRGRQRPADGAQPARTDERRTTLAYDAAVEAVRRWVPMAGWLRVLRPNRPSPRPGRRVDGRRARDPEEPGVRRHRPASRGVRAVRRRRGRAAVRRVRDITADLDGAELVAGRGGRRSRCRGGRRRRGDRANSSPRSPRRSSCCSCSSACSDGLARTVPFPGPWSPGSSSAPRSTWSSVSCRN